MTEYEMVLLIRLLLEFSELSYDKKCLSIRNEDFSRIMSVFSDGLYEARFEVVSDEQSHNV